LNLSGLLWRDRLAVGLALRGLCVGLTEKTFDELMDMCRSYGSESSNATNPVVFEPMVMTILLAQQKRILTLKRS